MTLWAIVPVKPLKRGKSRLAGVLSQKERLALNRQMLIHVLTTLKSVPEIEQILVISRDSAALSLARDHGARTVMEDGSSRLNVALTRATVIAKTYATRGVLVLPADLPLIQPEDVCFILAQAQEPPVVVISPDRHRLGTNALLVSPARLMKYEFGPDSFERHCQSALAKGARLEIVALPSVGLDVDLPEDLELVNLQLNQLDEYMAGLSDPVR